MISTNATIHAERKISDRLIASLRPFISKVARDIRSGISIQAAVDAASKPFPEAAESFENVSSDFGLKSCLLFDKNNRIDTFVFRNNFSGKCVSLNHLTDKEVFEVGETILLLEKANQKTDLFSKSPYQKLIQALFDAEIFVEDLVETNWRLQPQEVGIVRLQHASFLLNTLKARIIVDPHFVSGYSSNLQTTSRMLPQNFIGIVDAVLITHSHRDHYHIPSLLTLPRDILIIVPRVNEATILSPDFAKELRAMGFKNVIDLDWYSGPVCVDDIEISALPFYGEQPLRYEYPRDKRLRNWGNSYFFRTPFFSAFCLIDSGSDANGSMNQVAEYVKHHYGGVDVVLSNLQEFQVGVGCGNPFYVTGNGLYWLSLTADQIAKFPQISDLITLGPDGVAEICRITGAKTFLPYSHLWCEIGSTPSNESSMLQALGIEPAISEARTEIIDWRMGETWRP